MAQAPSVYRKFRFVNDENRIGVLIHADKLIMWQGVLTSKVDGWMDSAEDAATSAIASMQVRHFFDDLDTAEAAGVGTVLTDEQHKDLHKLIRKCSKLGVELKRRYPVYWKGT